MNLWRNSWEKFVGEVARCYSDGIYNDELVENFLGKNVCWSGEIRNVELGQEITNGVAMDMPETKIRLVNGQLIVANYIFLSMNSSTQNAWLNISPGQTVTFSADIRKAQANYPEVEVSICSYDPKIILQLGTDNAQPI